MRVLIIAGASELGGAPRSMMYMVRKIHDDYGVSFLMLLNHKGKLSDFCEDNGIDYLIDGHRSISISKGSTNIRRLGKKLLWPYYSLRMRFANKRALQICEEKIDFNSIDIIHTNSNRDGIGALIAQKYNKKHIWHLREFGKEDYDTKFLFPYNIEFMNANATEFIAISEALKNSWIKKGISRNKITCVYNGIDVNAIRKKKFDEDQVNKTIKMVFVGTLTPFKGQEDVIKAFAKMNPQTRGNLTIDFIGEGPADYTRHLKNLCRSCEIVEQVHFLGLREDVYKLLGNYDVGIVGSRSEAFGRITPEYMAAGLVVLASNTGANPELITDGINGYLFPYGDIDKLTKIMESLYKSKKKFKEIGEQNIRYSREKYSAEKNAENIYKIYKEMMGEK